MLAEQLKFMYSLERLGIKLGLEVMAALLAELGSPHLNFRSIHITGTTGKGSVAAMLESILRAQGYTTALYTSPHLFSFNERIRLNNVSIVEQDLVQLIASVRAATQRARISPTFFEFTTATAFCYFAQQNPDIAIIEVGMGGLLDATNVITPLVSVITNVGLDHTLLLGQTREKIAVNKAGIIKPGVPVITAEHDAGIRQILNHAAQHQQSDLRYTADYLAILLKKLDLTNSNQEFHILTRRVRNGLLSRLKVLDYTLPLLGNHQLDNVTTVLLTLAELEKQGVAVHAESVQRGLATTVWPGRLDLISTNPYVLVDGAHNQPSLHALYQFLKDPVTKPPSYDVLVIGFKKDKDITFLRDTIAPLFSRVITTEGSYEPMPAAQLADELSTTSKIIEAIPNPKLATQRGLDIINATGSLIITGSLYMIPAALEYLQKEHRAA